ncbi:Hypothetical protein, putative, partial [Bodo saltans]
MVGIHDIRTACRICAIPKDGQALRPIAIGEAIMKLSEAYVTEAVSEQVKDFIHPEQRALDDGGSEKTIHELRSAYKDGKAICESRRNQRVQHTANTLARLYKEVCHQFRRHDAHSTCRDPPRPPRADTSRGSHP